VHELCCLRDYPNTFLSATPQEIVANKSLQLKAIVGLWPANAVGDDIQVRLEGFQLCLQIHAAVGSCLRAIDSWNCQGV